MTNERAHKHIHTVPAPPKLDSAQQKSSFSFNPLFCVRMLETHARFKPDSEPLSLGESGTLQT